MSTKEWKNKELSQQLQKRWGFKMNLDGLAGKSSKILEENREMIESMQHASGKAYVRRGSIYWFPGGDPKGNDSAKYRQYSFDEWKEIINKKLDPKNYGAGGERYTYGDLKDNIKNRWSVA